MQSHLVLFLSPLLLCYYPVCPAVWVLTVQILRANTGLTNVIIGVQESEYGGQQGVHPQLPNNTHILGEASLYGRSPSL